MTAALGNTIDLMDQTRQGPLIVQEGESLNVSGQLVDFAGDPILKAGLVAFLVTLFDEATETVINGVDQQDRLAQVESDGSFTLKLNGEDNVIVDLAGVGSGLVEKHVLALLALERRESGSVGDPTGPVSGPTAGRENFPNPSVGGYGCRSFVRCR